MIILWIRKNKADKLSDIGNTATFQEHDDVMKRFRMSHPDVNMEASRDIVTNEGNLLAPVHQVKLAENIQN
jgi:hypothetical protein